MMGGVPSKIGPEKESSTTTAVAERDVPEDCKDWSVIPPVPSSQTDSKASGVIAGDYHSWDFNIWGLSTTDLIPLSMRIINHFQLPKLYGIKPEQWVQMMFIVESLMGSSSNPYHNYFHIMDVTHSCFCIVTEFDGSMWLNDIDIFALLISAIVHDLEHPGTNNLYQINASTPLAIRYNDISVLENHHCAKSFEVFSQTQANIFLTVTADQRKYLRKSIIALVLSTDMSSHFSLKAELDDVVKRNVTDAAAVPVPVPVKADNTEGTAGSSSTVTHMNEKDTLCLLKSILHTSDISNPAKKWEVSKKWSDLVLQEFFEQGDREKREQLPVSMNCDRDTTKQDELSMNFCDFIVAPFFFSLTKLLPKLMCACRELENNRNKWHDIMVERVESSLASKTEAEQVTIKDGLIKWDDRRRGFTDKIAELDKSLPKPE